jgi:plastocyanin
VSAQRIVAGGLRTIGNYRPPMGENPHMRTVARILSGSLLIGLVLVLGTGAKSHSSALASTARVFLYDNDGAFRGGDPATGLWGFYPNQLAVVQGAPIVFESASVNHFPHTVTSFSVSRSGATRTLESGTEFASSPTPDLNITPGTSYTLDTSSLDPGHYAFYCSIHTWMVGSFTVMPQP